MADRRYEDEQRRDTGSRRDPNTERQIERQADRYRGSDERGYDRGERRFRDPGRDRDVLRYADVERDRREPDQGGRGPSPSGAFHDHERDHSRLAGLHDLEDTRELRAGYREHRWQRSTPPRYGHGPGVENMEAPRMGYSTSTTRGSDHELGHGGFLGAGSYRSDAPMPRGRAPKGYQRSDERIREDICDGLMMSWMNAENVEVQVKDGEVILLGTVKSRNEKRAIEALAESVLGVKDLINSLRVERREQPRGEQAQEERRADEQAAGDTPLHS